MLYGTSKDWDLFNMEERGRRELFKDGVPYCYEPQGLPDNYEITCACAIAYNKSRPPLSAPFPHEIRKQFKKSLRSLNLCWRCKLPLKTVFNESISHSVYADIRPHFDTLTIPESGTMIPVFVDGGAYKLFQKMAFLDLATLRPIRNYKIPSFYRVEDQSCLCGK